MRYFIIMWIFLFGIFIGAFSHERDMARNFHRDGDAHAWFVTIKCEDCRK